MLTTTEAIPISTFKYGDSSLIAHCFTLSKGMRSFLLKGILTSKKKALRKSLFEPLNPIEITASFKDSGNLSFIREAQLTEAYQSIPFDIHKKTLLLFLSEVLFQVLQEEPQKNESLFGFLKSSLLWLDKNDAIANFHIKFLLDLTAHIGFYPNIENLEAPFFDLESGSTTSIKPAQLFLEKNLKTAWIKLLGIDFDALATVKLTREERKSLLNNVIVFFELHLQRFKKPKSTSVLNEVFKNDC